MAQTTKSRGSSTSAKKKSTSSRKPAARKKPATKGPGMGARVMAMLSEHVGNHRHDVLGLGMLLVAALTAMGLWFQSAGPVGAFLEAASRGLFGVYANAVPFLLVWFGGMIVLDRPPSSIGRQAVGLLFLLAAALGGWHLIAGSPKPSDGVEALWPGGGVIGWGISAPLEAALSVWGAGAVFLALLFLGVLITTATPFSAVVEGVRDFFGMGDEEPAAKPEKPAKAVKADPVPDDRPDLAGLTPEERATVERAERRARAKSKKRGKRDVDEAIIDLSDEKDLDRAAGGAAAAGAAAGGALFGDGGRKRSRPGSSTEDGSGANGLSAADREAGRAPAPPAPDLTPAAQDKLAEKAKQKARKLIPVTDWSNFTLPPMDLLAKGKSLAGTTDKHIQAQVEALQETFDQFRVDATVARWSRGPTVTRFEIELGAGVQVKKVANMGDDIAYALAAPDVRIVAPIPGKSAIGVEVPNRDRDLVTLGDILRSDEAKNDPNMLTAALGVDIAGNPALVDLSTMPHLLVSGATGSGKSITINSFITSIIMRARPDQVRLVLIDPKRVELNHYDGAPHLITPVITDPRKAADAVQWCVKEMELRYEMLARLGYRDITGYNQAFADGELTAQSHPAIVNDDEAATYKHMPFIVLVIDELADLMLVAPRDVEDAICRIAQMARAVGIHMVIATQRPSVDVITGLIKANIPSRLALAVASQTDSRTILDTGGAEKLVGKGDMLFLPASQGKPSRLQGCFVHEREIQGVVDFCKKQRDPEYVEGVFSAQQTSMEIGGKVVDDDSDEALLRRAAQQVVESGLGSTSMLQRKLRIGFARAGRLMDELEELGVVGPNEGSKAREVNWTPEMLEQGVESGIL